MENNNEKIKMERLILAAAEWMADPESVEAKKAFEDVSGKLFVRSYMPLDQKMGIIKIAMRYAEDNAEIFGSFSEALEVALTFKVLFAYTNVDIDFDALLNDAAYYEILWTSGVCDDILSYCEKDYNRTIAMLERTMNYVHLKEMVGLLSKIDTTDLSKFSDEFERFKTEITPEMLHDIAEIAANSDKHYHDIKNIIEDGALNAVNKMVEDVEKIAAETAEE